MNRVEGVKTGLDMSISSMGALDAYSSLVNEKQKQEDEQKKGKSNAETKVNTNESKSI